MNPCHGPIELYWFSGTGNTLLVVQRITDLLQAAGRTVHLRAIEMADPAEVRIAADGMLGLAFPVAMGSTYPFIWRFLEKLPPGNGAPAFAVATLAGFAAGMLARPLRQLLEAKGYRPLAIRQIRMPSNYLASKPLAACGKRLGKGDAAAAAFADQLLHDKGGWPGWGCVSWNLLRRLMPHGERLLNRAGRKFQANSELCTRCGLCVRLCPVQNITPPALAATRLPEFGPRCQQCQRCIAACPARAIRSSAPGAHGRYRALPPAALLRAIELDPAGFQTTAEAAPPPPPFVPISQSLNLSTLVRPPPSSRGPAG
ncbi:MAG: EFR1 family ferrodoxin [Lentisphaeria bacterium]|jgi:NAD-dependent dihydropyrimidine dehydrogenase PreA subunit